MVDLGKLWPLEPKPLTWGQISETTLQIGRFIAHLLLLPLVAICHSFGSREAQLEPCTFDRRVRTFCNDYVIWPWKYWPRVTKFAPQRILIRPTYLPNFVFLALMGAEIAGRWQILPPPLPGRVILRPSPGSVLTDYANSYSEIIKHMEPGSL